MIDIKVTKEHFSKFDLHEITKTYFWNSFQFEIYVYLGVCFGSFDNFDKTNVKSVQY